MFSYASKRITRGRGLSLALFLSVVLAATLFSGILQGADAVGGSALDNMLTNTKYDIIATNTYEKNTTAVNIQKTETTRASHWRGIWSAWVASVPAAQYIA